MLFEMTIAYILGIPFNTFWILFLGPNVKNVWMNQVACVVVVFNPMP